MEVTITINNVWSKISGLKNIKLVDTLDYITSFYVQGYQYSKAFKNGYFNYKTKQFTHWDGKKHLLTQKMVFPTGLLNKVCEFLKENKIEIKFIDQRPPVVLGDKLPLFGFEPRQYQIDALNAAIQNGRGIIRVGTGGGKCFEPQTKVLKYDGTIITVENIKVGDILMGPDSLPRKVLSTTKGFGPMYRITPVKGDPWECNDVHVLTLVRTVTGKIIDIPLNEYLNKSKKFKHLFKQFSVGVDFQNNKKLEVDPYFLGLWFGDGTKAIKNNSGKKKLSSVQITTLDGENILLEKMRKLLGEKLKIPHKYLTSSRENRLKFLAGWIDSDGYLHHNCYEVVQKRKDYMEGIAFLARSLGFKVVVKNKYVKGVLYYRINILGDVSVIPVKIPRKKATIRKQKKNALRTGFKVESIGDGEYAGFELDGDGRFLLGDFTVTHNTAISSMIVSNYNVPTMIYVVGKDLLYQFHKETQKALNKKIGIIGDGHCDIKRINICSIWTAAKAFDLKTKVSLDDEDWNPDIVSLGDKDKQLIKKVIENVNLSIFDEAHFLATDTIQSIFKAGKKCKYLFGLSGTDWRDDGADLLLESVCGPRIFNMPSTELINQGYLVPPKIILYEVPPLEENLPKNYQSVYSKYILKNDVRNKLIEDVVRKLIEKDRKVLVLVKNISHGNELKDRLSDIDTFFVNGDIDGEKREEVKLAFTNGEYKCLIASSVFDIGVDIPILDALVLCGGGVSSVRALQRIGRVIRLSPGKKDAFVIDFIDNARYLDTHSATRISIYETEPGFKIKFTKNFDSSRLNKPQKNNVKN